METLAAPITKEPEGTQSQELGVPLTQQEIEEPTEELIPAEVSTKEVAPTEDPTEEPAALMVTVSKPAEEPDIPPVQCKERKGGHSTEQVPWLDTAAASDLAGDPHWLDPCDSWWTEAAMQQPECRKEGPVLTS